MHHCLMKKPFLFLLFFVAFSISTYGQFSPSIHNYSIAEYKAGNQNWDTTRADDGKVYVANNSGLLEYDALGWNFYQLPNKTTVRSVLAVDDLIFTGSYEEFGYWQKDKTGVLQYTSLSDTILNEVSKNEEIWQIVKFKDKIVFRSFINIYVYDFEDIERLRPGSTIISCSVIDDVLYLSTLNQGIFTLENNQLNHYYSNDALKDVKIMAISKYDDKLLLVTSLKGSFFLENNRLTQTGFEIDQQLKQHQLNEFSNLSDGSMAFGTIKDGVFITDKKGQLKFHVSKENGLINNTILGQFLDEFDNLWLGLDNGVASIALNSHNYFFNDVSGKLGAVYDIVNYKDVIYIGSNTGLFKLNDSNRLHFIEGSQGQVWDLTIIDDQLFCGHNEGTFLVEGDTISKISDFTGGWTIQKVPESNDIYIQGTYTGLVKFEKKAEKWNVKHLGGTTIPSKFIVFENPHTAWVAHAYKGLYRVDFSDGYDTITKIEDYHDKGIYSNYNLRVYNIKNNISFKTNNGWQKYEPILDSIVPYKLLNQKLGKNNYIISEEEENVVALKNNNGFVSFKDFLGSYEGPILNDRFFNNRYIVGYENVSKINDSIYALNLDNGFMMIDSRYKEEVRLFKPIIEKLSIDNKLLPISSLGNELTLGYNKELVIEITSPKSENHFFEYKISDNDNKWYKVDGSTLELSNLKDGNYTISLRSKNNAGHVSEAKSIEVEVLPPWYKDTIGFLLYVLIGVTTIFFINRLQRKKVEREQRRIRLTLQREQQKLLREKTLENEKRIVQLKNESLQNEIKIKSKQLANNAMALVKKNEVLQNIKSELTQNKDGFNNYYSYKKLVKKLDHSIEHKDEWEVFEENFNQVHDEFFEILKKRHSALTPKDLKICAYIKMNLANKEIAPLMNISVRGVETHRYRLKKKLNLENDISLADYLLNIK